MSLLSRNRYSPVGSSKEFRKGVDESCQFMLMETIEAILEQAGLIAKDWAG
jgi:hypothetical protein